MHDRIEMSDEAKRSEDVLARSRHNGRNAFKRGSFPMHGLLKPPMACTSS